MFRVIATSALCLIALSGCDSTIGYKQPAGAALGGAAGGWLGSNVGSGSGRLATTAAGALLGAMVGSETGRSLDKADAMYSRRAYAPPAQVPIPPQPSYFCAPQPYAVPYTPPSPAASIVPSHGPVGCRPLAHAPGQVQSYACQATDGSWFIVR